jgi:hypothetical protein
MRRYLASLALVGGAAVASPAAVAAATETPVDPASTVAVQQVRVPAHGLRDEAAMVLVGTALIGLAAAVRRAA